MLTEKDIENETLKPLTEEELIVALPRQLRKKIPSGLLDTINNISSDPYFNKTYRENFISYLKVLEEGSYNIYDYLNAVKYISYKLMGYTNKDSWIKVFPDRYARLMAKGADDKELAANYTAYNKGKLVNLIYEQTLIPLYIINQPLEQEAINRLAHLMTNAHSEMVQMKAADSLLTHIKKPEAKEVKLNIGINRSSEIDDLMDTLTNLANKQKELISQGLSTKDVVQIPLLKEEIIDVEAEEIHD